MRTSEKWNGQREFGRVKWNGSRSERNGTGSGCRCRSAFGWEDHRVAHHSCVIVCRLEQMDLSVRLSTWFVILDMRGRGGVRITNQQKVRLINSHANWLAEMHSCTLQASHLYNIYIPISYTSAGLIPASLPTAVSYISRHSNHSAISMPYPAFVSAWGLIDFHLIHFSDGLKCWKRYSALNKMAALWRRRLDPPSLSFLIS